jgi:hypothetical protein
MSNLFRVMNVAGTDTTVTYYFPDGQEVTKELTEVLALPGYGSSSVRLGDTTIAANKVDTYGIVAIEVSQPGAVASELVRYKRLANGKYEFAIETLAR